MNNDKIKAAFAKDQAALKEKDIKLADEKLIKISGGTTEDFDPEIAPKANEEWLKQNGIQCSVNSSVRFG